MEDVTVNIENPDTTEVIATEDTTVLVREYIGGKNIAIEDNVINCTYEYQLPASVVMDNNYVHTDNNFTTAEKEKLAKLENADLSGYYTKEQTDQAIENSHENYYTKQETRKMINEDLESYYTSEETDAKIADGLKDHYTKTEVDTKLENHYTKAETDNTLKNYYTKTEADNKVSGSLDNYYTKNQVDNLISSGSGGGGASTAAELTIADAGNYFASTNVEGALQELGVEIIGLSDAISTQSGVVV